MLYDAKRILGKDFDDYHLEEYGRTWPFKIVPDDKSNKPMYEV